MRSQRMISIDTEIYNQPIEAPADAKTALKRLKIKFFLSPSDIPQLINQSYNQGEDILSFEFKYINAEKEKELFHKNNIKFFIGVYSGKPLRLEIKNIKKDNITSVKLEHIISALKDSINVKARDFDFREQSNLRLAGMLFANNAKKLSDTDSRI